MSQRRLAVLGTVAVLTIAGLAGTAMADDHTPAVGTQVTCPTPGATSGATPDVTSYATPSATPSATSYVTPGATPSAIPEGFKKGAKQGVFISPDGKVTRISPDEGTDVIQSEDGVLTTESLTPATPQGTAPSDAPTLTSQDGEPSDAPTLTSQDGEPSDAPTLTSQDGEPSDAPTLTPSSGASDLTVPSEVDAPTLTNPSKDAHICMMVTE
ncbi:hypothetical protein [Nonomuraea sp. NPDC050783]|uniref:hypothetical protein n=1 Tax=Nonomuraea sp. NPDC050783 TaxID=3154634 RepID=UPI00346579F1